MPSDLEITLECRGDTLRARAWLTRDGFVRTFCARTKALRRTAGMTQAQMALALGVSRAAYEKYENRSPLPHALVARFAALTGAEIGALF